LEEINTNTLSPQREEEAAVGSGNGSRLPPRTGDYLNHRLECPFCGVIRLHIPIDAQPFTPISCAECGKYLGTWDELQTDFENQGGCNGVFRLEKGRIRRLR
jgi:hypothetical protein